MRAFTDHAACPPDGAQRERGRRHPGAGPAGVALLVLGLTTAAWAHLSASDPPRGSLLSSSLLTLAALGSTSIGMALVLDSASSPVRRVFRFGVLRLAAGALFLSGALHVGMLLWFDFFRQVWADGHVDACAIAGVGSLGAGVGSLLFAAIAARLAWRAFLEEYWAH